MKFFILVPHKIEIHFVYIYFYVFFLVVKRAKVVFSIN